MIEGEARSLYGEVNIGFVTFGNMGKNLSRRRIVGRECSPGGCLNPLAADEELMTLVDELEG
jgi:hypothetical protein